MTRKPIRHTGPWVKVRLPDGRPALVATKFEDGRKLVVVKPLREGATA